MTIFLGMMETSSGNLGDNHGSREPADNYCLSFPYTWSGGFKSVLSWAQHWRHLDRLIEIVSRSRLIVSQQVCALISSRDRDRDKPSHTAGLTCHRRLKNSHYAKVCDDAWLHTRSSQIWILIISTIKNNCRVSLLYSFQNKVQNFCETYQQIENMGTHKQLHDYLRKHQEHLYGRRSINFNSFDFFYRKVPKSKVVSYWMVCSRIAEVLVTWLSIYIPLSVFDKSIANRAHYLCTPEAR
jgi:hypothetical protein